MTEEQKTSLESIFGEAEITQYDKTVTDVKELVDCNADVYAVVLPADKIAELYTALEGKARIIAPVSERVFNGEYITNPATGCREKEYVFRHKCWKEYVHICIETKIL